MAGQAYAGFWIRVLGWLVDAIILGVVGSIVQLTVVGSLVSMPTPQPGTVPDISTMGPMMGRLGLASLINIVIAACYEAFFVANLSATPGKMVIGVKVVRPDGSRVGLGRAFGRYFAKILSGLILCIGYIMVGFDSQKRGLHDMICDTRVDQEQKLNPDMPIPCARCSMPLPDGVLATGDWHACTSVRRSEPGAGVPGGIAVGASRSRIEAALGWRSGLLRSSRQARRGCLPAMRALRLPTLLGRVRRRGLVPVLCDGRAGSAARGQPGNFADALRFHRPERAADVPHCCGP